MVVGQAGVTPETERKVIFETRGVDAGCTCWRRTTADAASAYTHNLLRSGEEHAGRACWQRSTAGGVSAYIRVLLGHGQSTRGVCWRRSTAGAVSAYMRILLGHGESGIRQYAMQAVGCATARDCSVFLRLR
jgi:hypothetical protein